MINTVALHSSGAKNTVEESKMIRNKAVRKVTLEECNTNLFFFSVTKPTPKMGIIKPTPRKGIIDTYNEKFNDMYSFRSGWI